MEIFLNKFLRQIRSTNDNSILQYGDAGIMLQNLRDHALLMKEERMESFAHKKIKDLSELESRLIAAYDANSPGACSWGRRWMMPTDALLFRIEREALRKIVSSPEHNVLENMDRVAAPNSIYRRSNVEDDILEDAITSFNKSEKPEPRAGVIDVLLLILFPVLYLLDIGTDIYVAYKHCHEANYIYFGLTLVFIFGPMLAELIGNMYLWKWGGSSITWKEVFSLRSLRLLPRAFRSLWYAVHSRREFDSDQVEFIEELHRLRGNDNKKMAVKIR
ncbi:uncharacterized protein LOC124170357 [Ischnura elegans]|uniref:uncharacterized protein LOC124170357 n=1 Tax=Ischnura elegans TaxID=197161 RepID=UPI001ED86A0F|nr:uncharacterized protein LOC124170357 [Ischnura elegans]